MTTKLARFIGCAILLLVVAAQAITPVWAQDNQIFAFVNVNIIPMDSERILENHTLVVQGDRIIAIEPNGEAEIPDGATIIDGNGGYLLPGLADFHIHSNGQPLAMAMLLRYGVTTTRILNTTPDDFAMRPMIANGELVGPTLFFAPSFAGVPVQLVRAINGMADVGAPFYQWTPIPGFTYSAEEAEKFVQESYEAGAEFIKSNLAVSREVFDAAVEAANELDMQVIGHVSGDVGVPDMLNAGAEIQHTTEIFPYLSEEVIYDLPAIHEDDLLMFDEKLPEVVDLFVMNDVPYTPTLIVVAHAIRQLTSLEEVAQQPQYSYFPERMQQQIANPETNGWYRIASHGFGRPEYQPVAQARGLELVKALYDADVMLLAGTDSSFGGGPVFGYALLEEVTLMAEAGLTPYDAIATATRNPAIVANQLDEWGTLEVGKRADVVLLSGNPLDDIQNIHTTAGVMVRGQWFTLDEIEQVVFEIRDSSNSIELAPYANEESGFSTLVPSGWKELMPGVYSRGDLGADPTLIGQMAFPTAARDMAIGEILTQLGVGELPAEPARTMDSESLSWSMYMIPGDNMIVVALAESEATTYMIVLQTAAAEFDGLAETLLVPAMMAFTPAE